MTPLSAMDTNKELVANYTTAGEFKIVITFWI